MTSIANDQISSASERAAAVDATRGGRTRVTASVAICTTATALPRSVGVNGPANQGQQPAARNEQIAHQADRQHPGTGLPVSERQNTTAPSGTRRPFPCRSGRRTHCWFPTAAPASHRRRRAPQSSPRSSRQSRQDATSVAGRHCTAVRTSAKRARASHSWRRQTSHADDAGGTGASTWTMHDERWRQ